MKSYKKFLLRIVIGTLGLGSVLNCSTKPFEQQKPSLGEVLTPAKIETSRHQVDSFPALREPASFWEFKLAPLPENLRPILKMSAARFNGFRVAMPMRFQARLFEQPQFSHRGDSTLSVKSDSGKEYQQVLISKIALNENLSEDQKHCWDIFLSGGYDCQAPVPPPSEDSQYLGEVDLLAYSRELSSQLGLVRAREILMELLRKRDGRAGVLEEQMIQATKDKKFVVRDSVVEIPQGERKKIGLFVVFGIDLSGDSPNRALIRKAAQVAVDLGFSAHLLNTLPSATYEKNAELISAQIRAELPKLEKVIVVAASKGVADTLTFLLTDCHSMTPEERAKFKLIVSLSGVVRESQVAGWMMNSHRPLPWILRTALPNFKKVSMDGILALTKSPWGDNDVRSLHQEYPSLKWISFTMLPSGKNGFPEQKWAGNLIQRATYRYHEIGSPSDGLIESAATVLPPGTGVPQEVIRGFGLHALALGKYVDGTAIAPQSQLGHEKLNPEAGAEILNSFLRVLTQEHLK